jgi:hypothetical protein
MNAEISILKTRVLGLYTEQRAYLASKPTPFLADLQHEADHVMREAGNFSEVAAAKINHAACTVILQERTATLTNNKNKK